MNIKKVFLFAATTCLLAVAPLQAQFISDSSISFFFESTPDNSTEGAKASGIAVSGEFHWDFTNRWFRAILINLGGTNDYPTGTLTSFGFNTPYTALQDAQIELIGFGEHSTTNGQNLDFNFVSPYKLKGMNGQLEMDIGLITGRTAGGGKVAKGIPSGTGAFFDFSFAEPEILSGELSVASFLDAGDGEFNISFRFQEIGRKGDSDAFGGVVIPEPSTYGIAAGLAGLAGTIFVRRFRNSSEVA